eukprot:CAMPEP_0168445604 /NCGR_PEP_ID=MMETSP0228-20121227/45653_1 /TAXON_ID=133427 /ORGANISM="Protoceratium reticulatum, Strain CCCM 535 (=CCMP 1889)" /LENGTH=53 /DNA_ID=CAMNT_0008460089 /DNA_START=236 /DNA_END=394 /DNA_ORIENTATION=-
MTNSLAREPLGQAIGLAVCPHAERLGLTLDPLGGALRLPLHQLPEPLLGYRGP